MHSKKRSTKELVAIALFAAILAVLAQVSIPMPSGMPLTLQTFAVALTGYFLGCRRSAVAVAIYLLLGAVGAPVFSMFRGGLGILFGVTGGFLFGFLCQAALSGLSFSRGAVPALGGGLLGLALCHAVGVAWYAVVTSQGYVASFLLVSAPYLLKDVASVAAAYFAARAVRSRTELFQFA